MIGLLTDSVTMVSCQTLSLSYLGRLYHYGFWQTLSLWFLGRLSLWFLDRLYHHGFWQTLSLWFFRRLYHHGFFKTLSLWFLADSITLASCQTLSLWFLADSVTMVTISDQSDEVGRKTRRKRHQEPTTWHVYFRAFFHSPIFVSSYSFLFCVSSRFSIFLTSSTESVIVNVLMRALMSLTCRMLMLVTFFFGCSPATFGYFESSEH